MLRPQHLRPQRGARCSRAVSIATTMLSGQWQWRWSKSWWPRRGPTKTRVWAEDAARGPEPSSPLHAGSSGPPDLLPWGWRRQALPQPPPSEGVPTARGPPPVCRGPVGWLGLPGPVRGAGGPASRRVLASSVRVATGKGKVGPSREQKGKLRQRSCPEVTPEFLASLPLGCSSLLRPEPPHPSMHCALDSPHGWKWGVQVSGDWEGPPPGLPRAPLVDLLCMSSESALASRPAEWHVDGAGSQGCCVYR